VHKGDCSTKAAGSPWVHTAGMVLCVTADACSPGVQAWLEEVDAALCSFEPNGKPGRWAAPAPPWDSARAHCCGCAAAWLLLCGLPCAAHPCP
jgi:hypothetical protein